MFFSFLQNNLTFGGIVAKEIVAIVIFLLSFIIPVYGQSVGRVEIHTFHSSALGINKSYYIYLPANYDASSDRYPVVYFLRQHESEWFDGTRSGRNGNTLKNVLDSLIDKGYIGKTIAVGPSTGSDDSQVYACVNMLHPELTTSPGIGTGRFEDYFTRDLIPHIDSSFRTIPDRGHRGIDGFSLGGFASTVLALRNPQYFCSVGSYDGTLMWRNLVNLSGGIDMTWLGAVSDQLFGAMFGLPRDVNYMLQFSVLNILMSASPEKLDSIRSIRFHIHAGYSTDLSVGNLLRSIPFVDSLAAKGIINTFPDIRLSPTAIHTFGYADMHASMSLIKHWETFQRTTGVNTHQAAVPASAQLYQNYPNPFNPTTVIGYALSKSGHVSIRVFDLLGREITTLVNEEKFAGKYQVTWGASQIPSGVYFYCLQADNYKEVKKLILLR
ncbi:MAG: T9SS C-terminal target domain-containing protein [Ignavibacteriae bacterium]|nr:MAG: T9SS C-terminal target domain-containing protein [Ignavibacteriota bacterium]